MEYKFTIIIPVFNEASNLYPLERELITFIETQKYRTKVLFVNDGSSDKSLDIIEILCQKNEAFHFISFDNNYGLSSALKAGFDYTETELVGYMDADLQTLPKDFNLLLEHINEYDLVSGMRMNRSDHLIKKITSKLANMIRKWFTNDGVDDTGCPLKVIKTEFAKQIPMFRGLHRFLPAMILLQDGKVKQVPIAHYPRLNGESKFGISNRLFGPLADCFAYLWMKKKYIKYNVNHQNSKPI